MTSTKTLKRFIENNIASCVNENGRISWVKLISMMSAVFPDENLNADRIRSLYRHSRPNGLDEVYKLDYSPDEKAPQNVSKTFKQSKDGELDANITNLRENPANFTSEQLANLFGLDPKIWQETSKVIKSWNTTMKGADQEPVQIVNYGVTAKFKRIIERVPTSSELTEIFKMSSELFEELVNAPHKVNPIDNRISGNTLVVGAFDVHLGKLAWRKETGENYDIKIASKRFLETVKSIVERAALVGIDRIIFPIGNDFFQFDNDKPTTTKDTLVDTDVRWIKLFQVGVAVLKTALDYCSMYAPVDVIWTPGNHDFKISFYAFETLRGYYSKSDKVFIDKNVQTRTYRLVGVNLLGFTHGDKEKNRLQNLMQVEAREYWGASLYSEWIVGHWHKGELTEDGGVVIRVLNSITGTDAWHYESGFVGSLKAAQGLVYNKDRIGPYLIIYESINITTELEQQ